MDPPSDTTYVPVTQLRRDDMVYAASPFVMIIAVWSSIASSISYGFICVDRAPGPCLPCLKEADGSLCILDLAPGFIIPLFHGLGLLFLGLWGAKFAALPNSSPGQTSLYKAAIIMLCLLGTAVAFSAFQTPLLPLLSFSPLPGVVSLILYTIIAWALLGAIESSGGFHTRSNTVVALGHAVCCFSGLQPIFSFFRVRNMGREDGGKGLRSRNDDSELSYNYI